MLNDIKTQASEELYRDCFGFGSKLKVTAIAGLALAALPIGGVPLAVGIGFYSLYKIYDDRRRFFADSKRIESGDIKTLRRYSTPEKRKDLLQSLQQETPPIIPPMGTKMSAIDTASPAPLKLRQDSHLLLMGATRSGKTSALASLIPSGVDVVYLSLKPDQIPSHWTGHHIDPSNATEGINAVLDRVEPLVAAMIRGDRGGVLWIVIDEILSISELCDRTTAQRLLSLVKVIVTSGAGMGCFAGLLLQSPNATDLGISAALMRNFQAVVCASEVSGFDYFSEWSEKFFTLTREVKDAIAAVHSGYWAVSGSKLCTPIRFAGELKKCQGGTASQSVTSHPTGDKKPSHGITTPVTPSHGMGCDSGVTTCKHPHWVKNGQAPDGSQRAKCKDCGVTFTPEASPPPIIPTPWGV